MSSSINDTLHERQESHGNFRDTATTAQRLKDTLRNVMDTEYPVHQEALEMICTKMARLACGDINHADGWHDIAGYATLIERHILESETR